MKLAIISDIHFPLEISRNTILYSKCGYEDSFYFTLEDNLKSLNPEDIDILIVCGDLCWDYVYFQNITEWPFHLPLLKLQKLRKLLDARIPIIYIEGNHDLWFNNYIYSEEGTAYFNVVEFQDFLINTYRLDNRTVYNTLDQLNIFGEDDFKIGDKIHLLRNDGFIVKDVFIYGLPNYDKKNLQVKFSEFKENLVQGFNDCVEIKVNSLKNEELPIKTILCQHVHPPSLKFVQAFQNPSCDIKAFYWGHYHTVSQDFVDKLKNHGPYQNVMPEKNDLKLQIYKI